MARWAYGGQRKDGCGPGRPVVETAVVGRRGFASCPLGSIPLCGRFPTSVNGIEAAMALTIRFLADRDQPAACQAELARPLTF